MYLILYTYTTHCHNLQDSNEVEQFRIQIVEAYALYIIVILVFSVFYNCLILSALYLRIL